jgi:hypothetical protein
MKTDKVVDGVLIKATMPPEGEQYEWPEGVKEIGDYAFYWYEFNQPFSIPEGVKKIGDYAFYAWESFNQPFNIPEGVKKIGRYAFAHWDSFNQPNSTRPSLPGNKWLRIDNWVFIDGWSGTVDELFLELHVSGYAPNAIKGYTIMSSGGANGARWLHVFHGGCGHCGRDSCRGD